MTINPYVAITCSAVLLSLAGCSSDKSEVEGVKLIEDNNPEIVFTFKDSISSDDPYYLVYSNITFVNALLNGHCMQSEIPSNALRSYFVDYYLAQVNNGGFSQFAYNSNWDDNTVRYVKEGLKSMKAVKHLALFKKSADIVDSMDSETFKKFLEGEYFGENATRDTLNMHDERFYEIAKTEDLVQLNSAWLSNLPDLKVLTIGDVDAEVERIISTIPNLDERVQESLANEPRFMKLIRALCIESKQTLSRVTAGNPHKYQGREVLAWSFLTEKGHHYMIDLDGKAMMFNGDDDQLVTQIDDTNNYK